MLLGCFEHIHFVPEISSGKKETSDSRQPGQITYFKLLIYVQ